MFETAGALVAFSSAANAGITIPAGDWTVDIGGNVNAFYTHTSGSAVAQNTNSVQTGLLPAALGIGAKTRQNDLDVAFQFSLFTGVNASSSDNLHNSGSAAVSNGGLGYNSLNIRQAFMSVGDASWGTVKFGRDLGTFGSDAILSDMTLLGVGSGGTGNGGSSTLGRIGSGYLYADWVAQIQYQTPNWNGFQAQGAVREGLGQLDNSNMGFDGKVSYSFAADDVTGKVWVGGITQKIQNTSVAVGSTVTQASIAERTAEAWEIGAKAAYQGAELVGYYYAGKNMDSGIGTFIASTYSAQAADNKDHDNSGGYVQATYKLPTIGTKIGASWGTSIIKNTGATDAEREAWIIGAYHPLTKSVNLVAEYNHLETTSSANAQATAKTVSLGAIMFF